MSYGIDTNGDGYPDVTVHDFNGDGYPDLIVDSRPNTAPVMNPWVNTTYLQPEYHAPVIQTIQTLPSYVNGPVVYTI